jgi:hypothetical protein
MANPVYSLWLTDKADTKSRSCIGAVFETNFGQLSIKLGPGVLIDAAVREGCFITLKPWREHPERSVPKSGGKGDAASSSSDDSDVPF